MSLTAEHRPATRRRRFRHDDLVAVDLFSGFGGLTQGIERAGFTNPNNPTVGYTAGYYLTTGADPNPNVGHC